MIGPTSLFSFVGIWDLTREIRHEDGRVDRLTGKCKFTRSGPQLLQDEWGWLETAEGRFQASRRYVWKEAEGALDVFFADLRPFHRVPLSDPRPQATHVCPPDTYRVAYEFADWPVWRATWSVTGPRKAYVMESCFSLKEETRHLATTPA